MILNVCVIQTPNYQLPTFLSLCLKMLGYSPAKKADAAGLKDQSHLLSTLAAFKDESVIPGVKNAHIIYDIVPYSCLLVAYEQDMLFLLECLPGMPFTVVDTTARGVQAAIVTGTLQQWRSTVNRWCKAEQNKDIREAFNKVYQAFQQIGLAEVFAQTRKDLHDNTFALIEVTR